MKASRYRNLFLPGNIGKLGLKNRIIVTAMGVNMAEPDGTCGKRIRAYHERQAQGGAGLIIMGASGVSWPIGGVQNRQVAISDERHIPGVAEVAKSVHQYGAKIAMQLHMGGPNSVEDMLAGRPVFVPSIPEMLSGYAEALLPDELAASAFGNITNVDFHVMTKEDIKRFVSDFADAADRARQAGIDGIEIHGGHGYLLSSFLSPKTNQRVDEYGGTIENRARLLLQVIEAIRSRVGRDYPLWVKIDSREVNRPGGIIIDDAIHTARLAENAGIDAITVSAYHGAEGGKLDAGSHTPNIPAQNLPYAILIKKAVTVPIIASGKIEPEIADKAIANGEIDFFSMGRKLLADPALPNKLLQGRDDEILPCIYCYTCISAIFTQEAARCAVNPETGNEYLERAPACSGKRIIVIGGGPAGMEVARRLDLSGHRVTLVEKSGKLGGTLNFASLLYKENERLLKWLRDHIAKSGVEILLNQEATPELLKQYNPDHVIVATGAITSNSDIPGCHEHTNVFSGDDFRKLMMGVELKQLRNRTKKSTRLISWIGAKIGLTTNLPFVRKATHLWMPLGKQIVIIGGELVGLELAEFLMERGRKVAVVDTSPKFGAGLTILRRAWILDELSLHGVGLYPGSSAIEIKSKKVTFIKSDGNEQTVAADHIIIAKGAKSDLTLANKLRSVGYRVDTLGDCHRIGYIEGAMRSAAVAATNISAAELSAT